MLSQMHFRKDITQKAIFQEMQTEGEKSEMAT